MDFTEMMSNQAQKLAQEVGIQPANPESGQPAEPQPTAQEPVPASTGADEPPTQPEAGSPDTPAETKAPEATGADTTEPSIDYGKFLEESSEGLFKTVDEFKSSLEKVREYDALKAKVEELENRNPFANDYVSKLNRLYAEGKTQDQIDAFNSLHKLGDLSKLDPLEIKVQRLIFEGYPRATAERHVKSTFGLNVNVNEEDLSPEELAENQIKLEDAQVALKISSKEDLNFLQSQLAQIEESEDHKQTKILQDAARKAAYEKQLAPFADQLAASYEQGIKVPITVGDGDKKTDTEYKFDFDQDFRASVAKMAKEFFSDNPVTDENIRSFKDFANTQFIAMKLQSDILPGAVNHGYSLGYKAAVAEFENKSGLPTQQDPPKGANPDQAMRDQQKKVALGED